MLIPRQFLAAAVAAATLAFQAATARASGETTDLWWDPAESGWGVNVVQQGDVAFVTLFVYGPDGRPTWYVASDARLFALGEGNRPAFRGTLYATTGPWLGGPFDPARVSMRPVGYAVLEPRPGGKLFLEYAVEGLTVNRTLERLSFALPVPDGLYAGAFSLREAQEPGVPSGVRRFGAALVASLADGAFRLRVDAEDERCHYRGPWQPSGRYGRVAGTVDCEGGRAGTFEISDLEVTRHGLSGYLTQSEPGRIRFGRFAAARY